MVLSQNGLAINRSVPAQAQTIQAKTAPLMTNSPRFMAGEMNVVGSNRLNLRLGPLAVTRIRPASFPVIKRRTSNLSPGFIRGMRTSWESAWSRSILGPMAKVEDEQWACSTVTPAGKVR